LESGENNVAWVEAHIRTKWYLDPSSHLAKTDMGRKLGEQCPFAGGGAGSPSNTMWTGSRPSCMPTFILIHLTVWPQCTKVTDRQTDKQTAVDRIGRSVLQIVAQKRFALCYRTAVLSVCLSVCDVGALWPNDWMDQDETWHGDRPSPNCIKWVPSSPPPKGHSPTPHDFLAMSFLAKRLDGSRCHLVGR